MAVPFGTGTNAGYRIIHPETNRVGRNVSTQVDVFDIAEAQLRYQEDARTNHITLDKPRFTNAPWSEIRLRAAALNGDGLAASLCSGSNALNTLFWLSLAATNRWLPSQVRLAKDYEYERPKNVEPDSFFPKEMFNPELEVILKQPKDLRQSAAKFWRSKARDGLSKLKDDASRNNTRAIYALGLLHQAGDLVESNSTLAAEMFHKAADMGLPPAQEAWGSHCDRQLTNQVEAAVWCYRAATQGLVRAQSSLSVLNREPSPWRFDPQFQPKACERARWTFERASQPVACFATYFACNDMGDLYLSGLGVESNAVEAVRWYRCAIGAGVAYGRGEYNLALCYFGGDGVPQDDTEGLKWLKAASAKGYKVDDATWEMERAASAFRQGDSRTFLRYVRKLAAQRNARAQFILGFAYSSGYGVLKDAAEAVNRYRKAAVQGDENAENSLGLCYLNGEGVAKDSTEAVRWFRRAAEQAATNAPPGPPPDFQKTVETEGAGVEYNLGFCYQNGEGVGQDSVEAVKWFRKGAERGHASAQCALGCCYLKGDGVAKDDVEAAKWFRKAAEQGDAYGEYLLGVCWSLGTGVPKDEAEAVNWLHKAAEGGNARAQSALGFSYLQGRGVLQDFVGGAKWLRRAAEQGEMGAEFNLGYAYSNGYGVPNDKPGACPGRPHCAGL